LDRGEALHRRARHRAFSREYCSASAMIAKTATITHDFEVVDTIAAEPGTR
jgi:putative redox protein